MSDKLEKQGDKIPMNILSEVMSGTLDRLGYAPKAAPTAVVNVNSVENRVVMIPIDANALQEAREAIRAAEAKRVIEHRESTPLGVDELEVEPESPPDEAQDAAGDSVSIEPPSRS
jgi:hypothetical protein